MKILHLLFAICLAGCAASRSVLLAPGVTLELQDPSSFGGEAVLLHRVSITRGGETHQFVAQLEISKDLLVAVGLSPFGTTLFTLRWDGKDLDLDSTTEQMVFDPRYILADLQIALWPSISLRAPASIEEHGDRRSITHEQTTIIDVVRSRERTVLTHHIRGYTITLETLEHTGE